MTKKWDDDSNRDGKRPETLALTLNGVPDGYTAPEPTVTKDGDSWTYTWTGLPKNEGGEAITYTVTEGTVPDGYQVSGSPANDKGTITNKHEIETTSVTVTKKWDDDSDRDGKRPETLTLTLNGVPTGYTAPTPTITKDGDSWTYTWEGLPKNEAGEAIAYTVSEDSIPDGYELSGSPASNEGTITNKHAIDTTSVTVTKKWDDDSDRDGVRPEDLALTLNGVPDGYTAPEPTVTKDGDNWTYKWEGLPKNDAGKAITYTVSEDKVPDDYEVSGSPANDKGTITNKHEIETTSVTVTKEWDDASDQDGIRPDKLELTLNAPEGVTAPDPTITKDGDKWTYKWADLPKNDAGEEFEYTVTEGTVPSGYTVSGSPAKADGTITNSHTPEEISVTVTKEWDDSSDQDGLRPDDLKLTLNGVPEGVTAPDPTITKDGDKWTYKWEGLPKNDAGKEIAYTVSEDTVPSGYTASGSPAKDGGTIKNSHTTSVIDFTITKKWVDNKDQDGIRVAAKDFAGSLVFKANGKSVVVDKPTVKDNGDDTYTVTWTGLPEYQDGEKVTYTVEEKALEGYTATGSPASNGGTITNTHEPEVIKVVVKKVWDDNDDAKGKRPSSLKVTLSNGTAVTLDEKNDWTSDAIEVPKFEKGKEVEYTWTEETLTDGYKLTKTETSEKDGTTTTTLTNKYCSVIVDPPVQKIIKGKDDLYNKGDFTFTIVNVSAPDGVTAPMPTHTSVTNTETYERTDKPGYYEFGEIEFTVPGVYTYKVTESGSVKNVTNDPDAEKGKTITFTVTENADGSLSITPDTDSVQLSFTNTYSEEPKTGDSSNWILWIALMALAAGAGTTCLILLKKKSKSN